MSLISVQNATKVYPLEKTKTPALENVSLDIERSERVCLMGPSGSGKSTLLNLMGLIDDLTQGSVLIQGRDVRAMPDSEVCELRNKTMGFIFQSFNLIPVLSVWENVEYPLLLQSTSKKVRKERVSELLERVGIAQFAHRSPEKLSGGQRQRVAIARALVTKPQVVFADEPTAALDQKTGHSIMELMVEMNAFTGTTLIFSTHASEVAQYAKKIVRLLDGKIVAVEES